MTSFIISGLGETGLSTEGVVCGSIVRSVKGSIAIGLTFVVRRVGIRWNRHSNTTIVRSNKKERKIYEVLWTNCTRRKRSKGRAVPQKTHWEIATSLRGEAIPTGTKKKRGSGGPGLQMCGGGGWGPAGGGSCEDGVWGMGNWELDTLSPIVLI